MRRAPILCTLFIVAAAYAGHAPYLGGDIEDLIQATKIAAPGASPVPGVRKPITEKQRRDSTNYNSKFADIARAYAEGYKAAIKAVQARAFIAKRRLLGIKPRSSFLPNLAYRNPYLDKVAKSIIPVAPNPFKQPNAFPQPDFLVPKSTIPVPDNVHTQISSNSKGAITAPTDDKGGMVTKSVIPQAPEPAPVEKKSEIPSIETFTAPTAFTDSKAFDNAVEKSTIPEAPVAITPAADEPLIMKERSAPAVHFRKDFIVREDHPAFGKKPVTMWSEEERNKIAKLNARGRHRNVYFDGNGGDPFRGGGVLSTQNAVNKKHKKRRRRRSTNEDKFEHHATPYEIVYYAPEEEHYHIRHRRSHMPYLGQNLDAFGIVRAIPKSWTNPQKKSEQPRRQTPLTPAVTENFMQPMPAMDPARFTQFMAPQFRGTIPQPQQQIPMQAMMNPQMAMNYAALFSQPPPNFQQPPPNFQQFRSMIPGYPYMPGPFGYMPAPMPSGITEENTPSVETSPNDLSSTIEKKSTIPHAQDAPEAEAAHST